MSDSSFYIGRSVDLFAAPQAEARMQTVRYDPDDLTTHAVIVGMTGSGKTGLLINLLEEAALRGLPSIVIDPKGDLTNLLLHFPDLLPADFEPWIDPEAARRQNLTIAQLAETTATRWREGLAELGPGPRRAGWRCATPSITSSIPPAPPPASRSTCSPPSPRLAGSTGTSTARSCASASPATVTALLGLVGLKDIDPLRSREHILLSNILENAWTQEPALDLTELILQTQNPPFERLGAFPVNSFFPEKDRLDAGPAAQQLPRRAFLPDLDRRPAARRARISSTPRRASRA